MKTRTLNKSNPFVKNNPMHNPDSIRKKVSKTSGVNQYAYGKYTYYYRRGSNQDWIKLENVNNIQELADHFSCCRDTVFDMIKKGSTRSRGNMKSLYLRKEVRNEDNKN